MGGRGFMMGMYDWKAKQSKMGEKREVWMSLDECWVEGEIGGKARIIKWVGRHRIG